MYLGMFQWPEPNYYTCLDPLWQTMTWLEAFRDSLGEEDITWWLLVVPLTDGVTVAAKELAKCLISAWRWMAKVSTTPLCPPAPTMLNIGQFFEGCPREGDHTPWFLAYVHALQHEGEATEGRTWHPSGVGFTLQIYPLVDAFVEETGVELIELDIASCWGQQPEEVLQQKDDGPFADVISYLDELVRCVPTQKAWDELVFPPPLAEPHAPCQSSHLRYILGCAMDLGGALLPLRFHITDPNSSVWCEVCCSREHSRLQSSH